jgi:alanyl-tRNA synthetase
LRRLIRRFYYNIILLNKNLTSDNIKKFVWEIVDTIVKQYGRWRQEIVINRESIKRILFEEIEKFQKTIQK